MRELYAVELTSTSATNADAQPIIEAWLKTHLGSRKWDGIVQEPGHVRREQDAEGGTLAVLSQSSGLDATLKWVSEVALDPPSDTLRATVKIGVAAAGSTNLAPTSYDFGAPAIVRSILREVDVGDAGTRIGPWPTLIGTSRVDELVALLRDPTRRLPVVLVTRCKDTGTTRIDSNELAKELAGLAHVWVFSMDQAAWELTSQITMPMSAWDGAVRVYFPGFKPEDDPFRHRLWPGFRVDDTLTSRLRSWLGALSTARTPEHPVYARLREDARVRMREAAEHGNPAYLAEYAEAVEAENAELARSLKEEQERGADLEETLESVIAERDAIKSAFGEMARENQGPSDTEGPAASPAEALTVASAMAAVADLAKNPYYVGRVAVSEKALVAGRRFDQYRAPGELLRAVKAVMEVGVLYHENRLGESPTQFFTRHGFGYGSLPSPHLKVDEHTGPDQCLRIYWEEDDAERVWTITDIGRHR